MRRDRDAWQVLLDSVAQLYVRGADINWSGFDAPYARRRVALPTLVGNRSLQNQPYGHDNQHHRKYHPKHMIGGSAGKIAADHYAGNGPGQQSRQ